MHTFVTHAQRHAELDAVRKVASFLRPNGF